MFLSLMKNNMADMNRGPLGLYLHFPFCVRKCRYCDFLSFPSDEAGREAYLQRLKKEIIVRGEKYQDYSIETLFIGGGTPSLMTGQQLTELLDTVRTAFHVSPSVSGPWNAIPVPQMLKPSRSIGRQALTDSASACSP